MRSECVAAVCMLILPAAAHAARSPYSLGVGVAFDTDDNLYRAPAGNAVFDSYMTTSLLAGFDQTFGRQRVLANATVRDTSHKKYHKLNTTGYTVKLGWDGATVGKVSWTLSYDTNRHLASFKTVVDPILRVPNIETTEQATAGVQLGLVGRWAANLMLGHQRLDYSAPEYASQRYRQDSVGFGVKWNPTGRLKLSLGPRLTNGFYPQGRAVAVGRFAAETFERHDIGLSANWDVTGASTLAMRLSRTRQRHDLLRYRDFDGNTGQVDWKWQATGKTSTTISFSRDTGSETNFFTIPVIGESPRGSGDNSRLTTSLSGRIDWEATAKVAFHLAAQTANHRLDGSLGSGGALAQTRRGPTERSGMAVLGVRYMPTRNSTLSCSLGQHWRANQPEALSPYRANTTSCSFQLMLK